MLSLEWLESIIPAKHSMAASKESVREPETEYIGFETGNIFSIRMPDRRLLVQVDEEDLDQGTAKLVPLSGPVQAGWRDTIHRFGFQVTQGRSQLTGLVPLENIGRILQFINESEFYQKDADRILRNCLMRKCPWISLIAGRDLILSYKGQFIAKDAEPEGDTQFPYLHAEHIFNVVPKKSAIKAIEKVAGLEEGLVLVTPEQLFSGEPISVIYKGQKLSASVSFLCHAAYGEYFFTQEMKKQANPFIEQLYEISKMMAFAAEGRGPGSEHRLTKADFEKLYELGDKQMVYDLEFMVTLHRIANYTLSKLAVGIVEGLTVNEILKANGRQLEFLLSLLGGLGVVYSEIFGDMIGKRDKRVVDELLGKVLLDIAHKYKLEEKFLKESRILPEGESLESFAKGVTKELADAEQYSPPIMNVLPSIVGPGIITLGIGHGEWAIAGIFIGALLGSQALVSRLLKSSKNKSVREFDYYEFIAHLVAKGARFWPIVIPQGVLMGLNPVATFLMGVGAGHVGEGQDDVEAIKEGTNARMDLQKVLDALHGSLKTETRKKHHALDIVAREKRHEQRWEKGSRRFVDLDRQQNIPDGIIYQQARIYSQHVLFTNFRIERGTRTFIEDGDLSLPSGKVHELIVRSGGGGSSILESLADEFSHPSGSVLIRLPEGDFNAHEPNGNGLVQYFNCDESDYSVDPFKELSGKKSVKEYLKNTELFTDEEIQEYITHNHISGSVRSRLKVAAAFYNPDVKVVLLDDVFNGRLIPVEDSAEEVNWMEKEVEFFARQIEEQNKIILILTDGVDKHHREFLENYGIMGTTYKVKERKFIVV